jgi:hypothetical protein
LALLLVARMPPAFNRRIEMPEMTSEEFYKELNKRSSIAGSGTYDALAAHSLKRIADMMEIIIVDTLKMAEEHRTDRNSK